MYKSSISCRTYFYLKFIVAVAINQQNMVKIEPFHLKFHKLANVVVLVASHNNNNNSSEMKLHRLKLICENLLACQYLYLWYQDQDSQ